MNFHVETRFVSLEKSCTQLNDNKFNYLPKDGETILWDFQKSFKSKKMLKGGSFGTVYMVPFNKKGIQKVAVKVIKKEDLVSTRDKNGKLVLNLQEMFLQDTLSKLGDVVPTFYGCKHDKDEVYLVMEFLYNDLEFDEFILRVTKMSHYESLVLYRRFVELLSKMWEKNYAFNDFKPANLMIKNEFQAKNVQELAKSIRIIDLGQVQLKSKFYKESPGTPYYRSPSKTLEELKPHSPKNDLYSLAISILFFESKGSIDQIFYDYSKSPPEHIKTGCFMYNLNLDCRAPIILNAKRILKRANYPPYLEDEKDHTIDKINFVTLIVNIIKYERFNLDYHQVLKIFDRLIKEHQEIKRGSKGMEIVNGFGTLDEFQTYIYNNEKVPVNEQEGLMNEYALEEEYSQFMFQMLNQNNGLLETIISDDLSDRDDFDEEEIDPEFFEELISNSKSYLHLSKAYKSNKSLLETQNKPQEKFAELLKSEDEDVSFNYSELSDEQNDIDIQNLSNLEAETKKQQQTSENEDITLNYSKISNQQNEIDIPDLSTLQNQQNDIKDLNNLEVNLNKNDFLLDESLLKAIDLEQNQVEEKTKNFRIKTRNIKNSFDPEVSNLEGKTGNNFSFEANIEFVPEIEKTKSDESHVSFNNKKNNYQRPEKQFALQNDKTKLKIDRTSSVSNTKMLNKDFEKANQNNFNPNEDHISLKSPVLFNNRNFIKNQLEIPKNDANKISVLNIKFPENNDNAKQIDRNTIQKGKIIKPIVKTGLSTTYIKLPEIVNKNQYISEKPQSIMEKDSILQAQIRLQKRREELMNERKEIDKRLRELLEKKKKNNKIKDEQVIFRNNFFLDPINMNLKKPSELKVDFSERNTKKSITGLQNQNVEKKLPDLQVQQKDKINEDLRKKSTNGSKIVVQSALFKKIQEEDLREKQLDPLLKKNYGQKIKLEEIQNRFEPVLQAPLNQNVTKKPIISMRGDFFNEFGMEIKGKINN